MVTTQAIVDKMNSMTSVAIEEEVPEEPVPQQNVNIPVVEEINPEPVQPTEEVSSETEQMVPYPRHEIADEEVYQAQVVPI
jgi:hypothetical protein